MALIVLSVSGSFAKMPKEWGQLPGHKYAAIVADTTTGAVLYKANADLKRYPASLTKMMTLYLLFDSIKAGKTQLTDKMWVSKQAAKQPPTKLYLRKGQMISVEDGLKALVVRSANDVSVVFAEHLAGSEYAFVRLMNQTAKKLGMTSTHFRNSNGLPHSKQVSTARDMLRLAAALIKKHGALYEFFQIRSFRYKGRTYYSHNKLLANYPGVDGLKTGYIRSSGFNIATSATRFGHRVIAVVMGGSSPQARDKHMIKLLDASFRTIRKRLKMQVPMFQSASQSQLQNTLTSPPPSLPHSRQKAKKVGGYMSVKWVSRHSKDNTSRGFVASDGSQVAAGWKQVEAQELNFIRNALAEVDLGPDLNSVASNQSTALEQKGYNVHPKPQSVRALVASAEPLSSNLGSDFQDAAHKKPDMSSNRRWSVQVGVFRKKKNAELAIVKIHEALPSFSKYSQLIISRRSQSGELRYHTRFTEMSHKIAQTVCSKLKAQGGDCFLVRA